MYIYIYIIYTYTYIHTYIHTYVCTYVRTYIRTYVRTHMHTYVYTYMCIYIYIYTHAYTYTHMYTYVCIYIYICIERERDYLQRNIYCLLFFVKQENIQHIIQQRQNTPGLVPGAWRSPRLNGRRTQRPGVAHLRGGRARLAENTVASNRSTGSCLSNLGKRTSSKNSNREI